MYSLNTEGELTCCAENSKRKQDRQEVIWILNYVL